MLLQRNLLETVTLISCSGTVICIFLNCVTNISPITGVWFYLYTFFLFIVSVTLSFKFIQWLLRLNKPLKYDHDDLIKKYPYLKSVLNVLPKSPKAVIRECKEYDTNELSVISTVLERRLVSSWYTNYVSQEIGFPFACKQMLDQMIGKGFQICNKIETKDVYVDICSVLINHLKEYRKALKRHEKSPDLSIESLYKKSHLIFSSDKKIQSAEHCTNLLRVILKELVPWELWDTPHSELLVRILAKKLDSFIETTLSDPVWLNDKLMTLLKGKKPSKETAIPDLIVKEDVFREEKQDIILDDKIIEPEKEISAPPSENKPETPTIESALSSVVAKTTAPILQRAIDEFESPVTDDNIEPENPEEVSTASEAMDISAGPVLRQRRGRQGRNEVKIYDRIIEGSVKTWETDTDLQCISLGQDLLASLNGEITLSRLWEPDRLWFGEEDTTDQETDTSPTQPSPVKRDPGSKSSEVLLKDLHPGPKPAEVLLKDLQTTVHQAKSKIGDLQVPKTVLDVGYNNDEAAGMMEGLLDFGISNLKKGLRFTGLSDDSQDKSPSHREKERPAEKSPPPDSKHKQSDVHKLPETHRLPEANRLPEGHKLPEANRLPEGHKLSEANRLPETNRLPEANMLPEGHKLPEANRLPEGHQLPDANRLPEGHKFPEAFKYPDTQETGNTSLLQKEDNGIATVPTLVKQHRVSSQDSMVPSKPRPILGATPAPPPLPPDSPEPQYEEAADLSTSIAKLRSLLQQRAEAQQSAASSDIWWEGATETRGRTQQHPSSRQVDTATLADEYDMTVERNSSPNQSSNNMQRLDKLFQRTVTGVFNSIKTAVGAEAEEEGGGGAAERGGDCAPRDWLYVCTAVELSVGGAVARLVGSRRAYSHVDAALDSLEQLAEPTKAPQLAPEDFEEWCAVVGSGWCAGIELAAAAGLCHSHVTYRVATLLFADLAESFINVYLEELSSWLRGEIFAVFERAQGGPEPQPSAQDMRDLNLDETCQAIIEAVPALQIFGAETAHRSVQLAVRSASHQQINRDILYRALDILTAHFKKAAGLRHTHL